MTNMAKRLWHGLTLLLCVVFFAADMTIPLGAAAGVPYIAVVFAASVWSSRVRDIYLFAAIGVALTILGYFLSPLGGEEWKVLFNRGIAIFAILAMSLLGAAYHRSRSLARHLAERTKALAEARDEADTALEEALGGDREAIERLRECVHGIVRTTSTDEHSDLRT